MVKSKELGGLHTEEDFTFKKLYFLKQFNDKKSKNTSMSLMVPGYCFVNDGLHEKLNTKITQSFERYHLQAEIQKFVMK